jgi:hypothetical protein
MLLKTGAITGAIVGASVAVVMIALENSNLGRISIPLSVFIDRAIFTVCPLYALGFTKVVSNKASWFLAAVVGNAVLYGFVFAGIAGIISLVKRVKV